MRQVMSRGLDPASRQPVPRLQRPQPPGHPGAAPGRPPPGQRRGGGDRSGPAQRLGPSGLSVGLRPGRPPTPRPRGPLPPDPRGGRDPGRRRPGPGRGRRDGRGLPPLRRRHPSQGERMTQALPLDRRQVLHRRALWLEYFTVGWNVIEGVVAIGAGIIAGSVALIGFGADSAIEVISAVGLLWRLRKAGPHAAVSEESAAEKRALSIVALTFFLLAGYITWEAARSLFGHEEPLTSPAGIILAVLSLFVMTALAAVKQRVGKEMGSRALVADSKEPWVSSYLSLTLLLGVGAYAMFGWWWADPLGALAMLPVILWQGWETLAEARDPSTG